MVATTATTTAATETSPLSDSGIIDHSDMLLFLRMPRAPDSPATANTASTAGGNETDFLSWRSVTRDGGRVANMLMVTTTVWMLNGVTGHTTHLRPAVALTTETVEGVTGLEDRLLNTTAARDNADHCAAAAGDCFLLATGKLQTRATRLRVVRDDNAVVTRRARECTTVTHLRLDVADDATLRNLSEGEDVANGERRLHAADDRLTGKHPFSRDHQLLNTAVFVRVAELHTSERGTTAGLVLNGLHNTTHKTMALRVVENTQLCGSQALMAVYLVDGAVALTAGEHCLPH
ncbi:unnamed protein product [Trypanosoma congolense IL3000]|uniref:WGS project CAEQ00000000 data, annotated contig 2327 n=1 Tax=Trypanosoma congolense (strain IL3000) TaxID=1068625 RepID=F9WD66_TRYCI|nr:unnamed protein product [Trypanosoma congolense IL3000]